MSILGKIEKIIDVLSEDDSTEKGDDFERYVVDHFDEKYFSVVEWTSNISRKHDRFVESDTNPYLVMRYSYKNRNEKFCIECKYRSGLYEDKLHWSNPAQLERYKKYYRATKLPFFVVIGLGGHPLDPERMFCMPLEEAKYPALYPSAFEKFERNPEEMFFWRNSELF